MKRLLIGVGIAVSAIATYALMPGAPGIASADGPMDGLEQLSGVEIGNLSDLPPEPQPAAAPQSPAPAAPIEQPSAEGSQPASPPPANAAQPPAALVADSAPAPSALPATGSGLGRGSGSLILAGFAAICALTGLACIGAGRARVRNR